MLSGTANPKAYQSDVKFGINISSIHHLYFDMSHMHELGYRFHHPLTLAMAKTQQIFFSSVII